MLSLPIQLDYQIVSPALREHFSIAGHTFEEIPLLHVEVRSGEHLGRGESTGVFYLHDNPDGMPEQLESVREALGRGINREQLRRFLPAGGARNALDCAMWDLEASVVNVPAWQLAGLNTLQPLRTTLTLSANPPLDMAERAKNGLHGQAESLKIKLTGDPALDVARLREVRKARPDTWMGVDANQAYNLETIHALLPTLVGCRVQLLEQPFARGREDDMKRVSFPMPTAADESCQNLAELESLPGKFDMVNIKLDKCGGLTEALLMAERARELGLKVMVGNMGGTSLATAPAFILGQLCDVVDLDGPTLLANDIQPSVAYDHGILRCPAELWG